MPGVAIRPALASIKLEAPAETKKNSRWELIGRFPKEKTSDLFKWGYVPMPLFKAAGIGNNNPTLDMASKVCKTLKLGTSSFVAGPGAFVKAGQSIADFAEKRTVKSLGKASLDTLGVVAPVADGAELISSHVYPISEKAMTVIKGANFGALGITMTHNAVKSGMKIHDATKTVNDTAAPEEKKANAKDKRWQAFIDLAKAVSFIALAVIGLLVTFGVFALTAPVALAMTIASTSALVFSTWGFFNANIVDPNGKKGVNVKE